MSAIHGKSGTIVFSGGNFSVTSFTINPTVDTAESTAMGQDWKSYLSGFKDWTATVETNYSDSGIALSTLGTSATLTLDTTDGKEYEGTAICTGHSISQDMNDVVKCTWNFQGNGVLQENA